ncbi:helix-turn-helix domain-containing protein [Aquimarina sp. AD10]|nr:helix-turn-helix domain-containing protein [Aquimarina sp. AD10]RKM90051.1 helix-turn-helix domain-containing protein [Aquimarina sp. AD10]
MCLFYQNALKKKTPIFDLLFITRSMIFFKRLFFICCSIYTVVGYTQEKRLIIPDSIAVMPSNVLGSYIKKNNPQEAKIYERVLSNLKDQDSAKTNTYYYLGRHFTTLENYERGAYYYGHAAKAAKAATYDQFLYAIYTKKAEAYLKDWKNQKALDVYDTILAIAKQKKSRKHEIIANSGITIILKRTKQLDKALVIAKHNLKLVENSGYKNKKNHVNLYTIISEVYLDQKKYDSVILYADKGIAIGNSIKHLIGVIDLYTKKGAASFYQNDIATAFKYLEQAASLLKTNTITDKKSVVNLNYFLANCYAKQKEYTKAITLLEDNLSKLDDKDPRNVRTLDTYRLLADSYKASGNDQKFAFWIDKHTRLRDKFVEAKDQTVTKIYKKNTDKLGEEIAVLTDAQHKEKQSRNYMILMFAVIFIVLLSIVGYYYLKYKKNKLRFDDLIQKVNTTTAEVITDKKAKEVVIDDEKVALILKGLDRLEEKEYFLHTDCTLGAMAKRVKINTTYLSKIINIHKEKSFNEYINDLRIEYVLQRLQTDKKFRSFSITSIASEIGYKSDNSFTKHFKAKTGLNPSFYIKEIEKLEKTMVS